MDNAIRKNLLQTNSVKFYGGWSDTQSKVDPKALAASIKELKKMLKKQKKSVKQGILEQIKKNYYSIGEMLMEEEDAFKTRKDGYLRKWEKDLG